MGRRRGRTHVRDNGDEGMCDGEGERVRSAELKAVLHQREAVLPAEHTHVSQQVQRNLHVLKHTHVTALHQQHDPALKWVSVKSLKQFYSNKCIDFTNYSHKNIFSS